MALLTMRSSRICWSPLLTGRYVCQQQRIDNANVYKMYKDSVHSSFGAENVLQI